MKNKILVFTGAGVSVESGIPSFRTGQDGLWYNHKIEDVATLDGWRKDKQKVLDFYNLRRSQLNNVKPNDAHKIISKLQDDFDVWVVTQNVDDLHERAGSKNIIHLHGELLKSQSTLDSGLVYDCPGDIKIGDKCERGSQLRPYITWFGENLDYQKMQQVKQLVSEVDVCIIVGTSMQVSPANSIPWITKDDALIYYVDPGDINFYVPEYRKAFFYHIKDSATSGMIKLSSELKQIFNN